MKAVIDCHDWNLGMVLYQLKKFSSQFKLIFFLPGNFNLLEKSGRQITNKQNSQLVKANRALVAFGVVSSFKCFVVYLRIFICFSEKSLSCCRMIWTQPLISINDPGKKIAFFLEFRLNWNIFDIIIAEWL